MLASNPKSEQALSLVGFMGCKAPAVPSGKAHHLTQL